MLIAQKLNIYKGKPIILIGEYMGHNNGISLERLLQKTSASPNTRIKLMKFSIDVPNIPIGILSAFKEHSSAVLINDSIYRSSSYYDPGNHSSVVIHKSCPDAFIMVYTCDFKPGSSNPATHLKGYIDGAPYGAVDGIPNGHFALSCHYSETPLLQINDRRDLRLIRASAITKDKSKAQKEYLKIFQDALGIR